MSNQYKAVELPLTYFDARTATLEGTATEPLETCPVCHGVCHATWDVDKHGGGPYSLKVGPYHCSRCDWEETGCLVCQEVKCLSWDLCRGGALYTNIGITNYDEFLFGANHES